MGLFFYTKKGLHNLYSGFTHYRNYRACCSCFFDVQSGVNAFFKVVKVPITKSVVFNIFDEFSSCFKFSVRIGKFNGIGNVFLIPNESC